MSTNNLLLVYTKILVKGPYVTVFYMSFTLSFNALYNIDYGCFKKQFIPQAQWTVLAIWSWPLQSWGCLWLPPVSYTQRYRPSSPWQLHCCVFFLLRTTVRLFGLQGCPGSLHQDRGDRNLLLPLQTETSYSELTNEMVTQETVFTLVYVADLTCCE